MSKQNLILLAVCLGICVLALHSRKPAPVSTPPPPAAAESHPVVPAIQTFSVAPLPKPVAAPVTPVTPVQNNPSPISMGDLPPWVWRAMASTNLQAALAEALKLPEGNERNQTLAAVCLALAQTDPADAMQLAQALNLDQQPGATTENIMQQWASSDMSSALQWASQQPAGEQRDSLMTRVALVMSQSDPSDAANLATSEIPAGPAQDDAVMMVLHQWAAQDLPAAIAWANTLSSSSPALQQRALNELQGMADQRQAGY
jgi:hypothetical protein